jgi:hypothetical protein
MLVQLNPPLHMETPKGPGMAHFCIDYGPESNLLWVVFMDADGACWTVPNPEIRMSFNWSLGRRRPADKAARESGKTAQPAAQRFRPTLAASTDS